MGLMTFSCVSMRYTHAEYTQENASFICGSYTLAIRIQNSNIYWKKRKPIHKKKFDFQRGQGFVQLTRAVSPTFFLEYPLSKCGRKLKM